MRTLLGLLGIFFIIIAFLSVGLNQNQAFAALESITIKGNQFPEINSIFTLQVFVTGSSTASYGDFRVQVTIFDKETGIQIMGFPERLVPGTNTVSIDLRDVQGRKSFKVDETYELEMQYLHEITTFQFTTVEPGTQIPQDAFTSESNVIKSSPETQNLKKILELEEQLEQKDKQIEKLNEQFTKKDAVLMEQLRVIQDLATMIKKTIFEPIFNYFSNVVKSF